MLQRSNGEAREYYLEWIDRSFQKVLDAIASGDAMAAREEARWLARAGALYFWYQF